MNDVSNKILFVDDEANVLKALVRQLRKKFDITTAHRGQAGLNVIRRDGPFAVVVTDYSMPEMNGVELLREAHKLAPGVVSVMLTGFAQLEVVVAALHEGQIFRFLAKPWSQETLEATLKDWLERYRLIVGKNHSPECRKKRRTKFFVRQERIASGKSEIGPPSMITFKTSKIERGSRMLASRRRKAAFVGLPTQRTPSR